MTETVFEKFGKMDIKYWTSHNMDIEFIENNPQYYQIYFLRIPHPKVAQYVKAKLGLISSKGLNKELLDKIKLQDLGIVHLNKLKENYMTIYDILSQKNNLEKSKDFYADDDYDNPFDISFNYTSWDDPNIFEFDRKNTIKYVKNLEQLIYKLF